MAIYKRAGFTDASVSAAVLRQTSSSASSSFRKGATYRDVVSSLWGLAGKHGLGKSEKSVTMATDRVQIRAILGLHHVPYEYEYIILVDVAPRHTDRRNAGWTSAGLSHMVATNKG